MSLPRHQNEIIQEGGGIYGDGIDGDITIVFNPSIMSQDMYVNTLIVPSGFTLVTGGYRLFAKKWIRNDGTITVDGSVGSDSSAGGTGGSATGTGTWTGGTKGGNGGTTNGVNGTATNRSYGGIGGSGGSGSGGSGGNGGTSQSIATNDGGLELGNAYPYVIIPHKIGASKSKIAGGTGGGGGGGNTTDPGGGGGSGAGIINICARELTGTGTISANGGAGGDGDNTDTGGGGGGAAGGILILTDNDVQNGTNLTVQANGGSGGTTNGAGLPAADGANGNIYFVRNFDGKTHGLAQFGNGVDGDVTISTDTTLSRDMYYQNLTVNDGINLETGGFRIFIQETLHLIGSAHIHADGQKGDPDDDEIFAGGAGAPNGTLFGGGDGGDGNFNFGNGSAGQSLSTNGYGGAGGSGGTSGEGNPGAGGTVNVSNFQGSTYTVRSVPYCLYGAVPNLETRMGGGAGGGGGSGDEDLGQYGGGGGGAGGFVIIMARFIRISGSGTPSITADGGDGADGIFPSDQGVQGGGGGGAGGVVIVVSETDCNSLRLTLQALAGSGGSGGGGADDGVDGSIGITTTIRSRL